MSVIINSHFLSIHFFLIKIIQSFFEKKIQILNSKLKIFFVIIKLYLFKYFKVKILMILTNILIYNLNFKIKKSKNKNFDQ